jgi:hypothetical protein
VSRLKALLHVLLDWKHGPDVEVVVYANLFAGLAVGAAGLVALELSITAALLLAGAIFCAFTLALLSRFTVWIPLVFGTLVMSVTSAVLSASLGLKLFEELGAWLGGVLGLALGIWLSCSAYLDVFRSVAGRNDE